MMNIRYVRCIMYTSTYVECCWTIAKSNRKKNIISSFVRAFGRDIYPPTAQSVISEALAGHLLKLSTPSVAVEGLEPLSRSISNTPEASHCCITRPETLARQIMISLCEIRSSIIFYDIPEVHSKCCVKTDSKQTD